MRTANCIAAYTLESLKTTEPHLIGYSHTKTTGILMQTHTLEFHILSIEPESSVGIKADVAESEWSRDFVNDLASLLQSRDQFIHHGIISTP